MPLTLCGLGPLPGGPQADGPSCTPPSRMCPFDLQARWEIRPPSRNRLRAASRCFPGGLCALGPAAWFSKGRGEGTELEDVVWGAARAGKPAEVGREGGGGGGALVNSAPAPGAHGRPAASPPEMGGFKGERLRCVCASPPVRPPPVSAPVAVIADVPPLSLRCSLLAHARPSPPAPLRGSLCPSLSSSVCH